MSDVVYAGKDLEAMSFAVNYHKWILANFRRFLGRNIVEVGAGTGDVSALLLEELPDTLTLVEPSDMFELLTGNIRSDVVAVRFYKKVFSDVFQEILRDKRPDSVIYINVLEHIENDTHELSLVYECLEPGGKALIFVPALPQLYGEFDRQIGHYRRYLKKDLIEKAESAGFKVLVAKYFDFAGMIPWFIKYKVFGSASLEGGLIKVYDRLVVPVNRALETLVSPPLGKNLLFVFEKPI